MKQENEKTQQEYAKIKQELAKAKSHTYGELFKAMSNVM